MKTTPVIFRDFQGETVALFPYEAATVGNPYHCSSYAHLGQHGGADPLLVIRKSKPASLKARRELAAELRRIGCRLDVRKRLNHQHALEARRAQLAQ